MIEQSRDHILDDVSPAPDRRSFLSSTRALAACTREFNKLGDEIASLAGGLMPGVVPEVQKTPGRVIVQLGPAAVTLAWLRSTLDTAAEGRLLVIVWRGAVTPNARRLPEHSGAVGRGSATPVWEESFTAAAEDEHSWTWSPESGATPMTSAQVVAACAKHLGKVIAQAAA